MAEKRVRCAIYTRKSSEEGLEQSFNSLEAQREACRAYILSQKHEGWIALPKHYDDGGFSGGTMERPALEQLLADIKDGDVDTVLVYKVDRLTRSLADFAKIIELFDSRKISFVSVTQQFNTTTSMGRLTLNVLLSFAQFEREITGERIRDKFLASKKKGMWMGGVVPLGYDCADRRLIVNGPEAKTVREIFTTYSRLGCLSNLQQTLDRRQIRSKIRTSAEGRTTGGHRFSRGALHHLLTNRIYLGEVVHKGVSYVGQHDAIVSRHLWDAVAGRLDANNRARRSGKSLSTPSLLVGKLFDTNGMRFTPTHAVKKGKRYRYYTSQAVVQRAGVKPPITRFPAHQLERSVLAEIGRLLRRPAKWQSRLENSLEFSAVTRRAKELEGAWATLPAEKRYDFFREIVQRVVVGYGMIWIEIEKAKLLGNLSQDSGHPITLTHTRGILRLAARISPVRRGNELRIVAPDNSTASDASPMHSLVRIVAKARCWYEQIVSGKVRSIKELAAQVRLRPRHTRRILRCATLSPEVVEALLAGKHRPDVTINQVLKTLPTEWREQKSQILHVD
jgi:site-specific DNA recombinase